MFGDIFVNVKKAKEAVASVEVWVQADSSDNAHIELQRV